MINRTRPLSGDLLKVREEIEKYALDYGLDFPQVIFEVCDYDTINILAAQGGVPTRYPHWRFGMEYDQLSKGYAYGLQKIYEMVINTDPCYAYLLNVNPIVDQKIVMAHVFGHADFFKNNLWFANTNRKMMDVMANHGSKIRRYMEKYGQDRVEILIDKVLSLENLLDVRILYDTPKFKNASNGQKGDNSDSLEEEEEGKSQALKTFMNSKFNPHKKKKGRKKEEESTKIDLGSEMLPARDIMQYLMEYAPLKEWESDIIGILRDEAYYFLPQRMTKIMNEGWASYWHSTIMTQKALRASEIIDFADQHSKVTVMSRGQINPYKIGLELYRDIEYRWDTGRFGLEYQECSNMELKAKWDKKLGLGRKKIFEVRKSHNDITFIDEFFNEEFCMRQKLFTYRHNSRTGRFEINSREFMEIKKKLLNSLTNFGQPVIEIESANYGNRGELFLRHIHQGIDLDLNFAAETMRNIFSLWKRPINLATVYDDKETIFGFDGKDLRPIIK